MKVKNWWAIPCRGQSPSSLREDREYLLVARKPGPEAEAIPAQTFHKITRKQGRKKGNQLEKDTAKVLNAWLFEGQPILRRTPLSGGWSKNLGDVAIDPARLQKGIDPPPIYVECKHRVSIRFENLIEWAYSGFPNFYTEWLNEAIRQGVGRLVLLVLQPGGCSPWVVAYATEPAYRLQVQFGLHLPRHGGAVLFPLKDLAGLQPITLEKGNGRPGKIRSD